MKKIADAVLVAMMLMASIPGLAEDALGAAPAASVVEEQAGLPSGGDEAEQLQGC